MRVVSNMFTGLDLRVWSTKEINCARCRNRCST